jgi:hypothetical protein
MIAESLESRIDTRRTGLGHMPIPRLFQSIDSYGLIDLYFFEWNSCRSPGNLAQGHFMDESHR